MAEEHDIDWYEIDGRFAIKGMVDGRPRLIVGESKESLLRCAAWLQQAQASEDKAFDEAIDEAIYDPVITASELQGLFGENVPIDAVQIVLVARGMTNAEKREKLRVMAKVPEPPPPPKTVFQRIYRVIKAATEAAFREEFVDDFEVATIAVGCLEDPTPGMVSALAEIGITEEQWNSAISAIMEEE